MKRINYKRKYINNQNLICFFNNMCKIFKIFIFLKQSEYSIMLNSLWSIDFKLEKIMILNLTQSLRIIIFFGLIYL